MDWWSWICAVIVIYLIAKAFGDQEKELKAMKAAQESLRGRIYRLEEAAGIDPFDP